MDGTAEEMAGAAREWIATLTPEQRTRGVIAFNDSARLDWHYVPRAHPGVTVGEMSEPQRDAANRLLGAALSARGVLKAEAIMSLDDVLKEIEKGRGPTRDPLGYSVVVYGHPDGPQPLKDAMRGVGAKPDSSSEPWGWKIEGHHISLNFTLANRPKGKSIAVTPSFLGANPAEVRLGPRKGERVLGEEEDLGRELLASLDERQRAEAIIDVKAPADILTSPGRDLDRAEAVGLAYGAMNVTQRALLVRLLDVYAKNLRQSLAEQEMTRIRTAGLEKVRFAWAGEAGAGQPHYYRLTGPTFVIELDNTQDHANHVHTVWHDRERDFGRDALQEHYQNRGPDHGHDDQK